MTTRQQVDVLKSLTQGAAAHLLGLGPRVFRDKHDAPRNDDGTYDAVALVAWWRDQAVVGAGGDPELLASGDSPALEKYRAAKAALAELDLLERKRTLIPTDQANQLLSIWTAAVRRAG